MTTATSTYRPDIDGLRAIAVMAVVLYHAGFSALGGGFVGVDVFFVISGYLITDLILREVRETGRFRFARFYARRVRRLVPALLATVAGSWVAATLFFSPAQMQDFAASVPAALLSVSNVWFWFEADYFAAASYTKPLLHTWSLSVEEQFYLVWPALTVLVLARLRAWTGLASLVVIGAASLYLAEHWLVADRDAAFYLLPSRVVELAMGAACAWLVPAWQRIRCNALDEIGLATGLAAIVACVALYDHHTPFPGVSALLPCAATMLVVLCGRARFTGAILRAAPMVWTGRISYSLYLVHWPVTVFATVLATDGLSSVERWVVVALSLALGALSHAQVETRFRHGTMPTWRFSGAVAACIGLLALPVVSAQADGWTWRVPDHRLTRTDRQWRAVARAEACSSPAPKGTLAGDNPDLVTCQNFRAKRRDIYLWGDSHALHLAPGFARAYPAYNVHVLYMNGCVPQSGFGGYRRDMGSRATAECVVRNRRILDLLEEARPANVVVTSAKRSSARRIAKATQAITKRLDATEHKVAVLADFIRPGRALNDCVSVPAWLIDERELKRRCAGDPDDARRELRYNRQLARLLPALVPVHDVQCPQGTCQFFHRGRLLYRDAHHLNAYGSEVFVKRIKHRLPFTTNRSKRLKARARSALPSTR